MGKTLDIYVDGAFRQSGATETIAVTDPATQAVLVHAPQTTLEEIDLAVAAAKAAFAEWRQVPPTERARLMMLYQAKLKAEQDAIAEIICAETGKVFADAQGDVWRGIEVAEQACNIPSLMMGETAENVARGIDTYSYIQPIGVCVGITPFAAAISRSKVSSSS